MVNSSVINLCDIRLRVQSDPMKDLRLQWRIIDVFLFEDKFENLGGRSSVVVNV